MSVMILTTSGHIALATAIYNSTLHLAWGDLPPFLGAPTGLAVSSVSGTGLLASVVYSYKITATTLAGETNATTAVTNTLSSAALTNRLSWNPLVGANGYNVYGRTSADNFSLLANVTTTNWTDTGSALLSNVKAPTVDSTSLTPWTDMPPVPSITPSSLYRELGRRKISIVQYVVPDSNGAYLTSQGRWSPTANNGTTPSSYIYGYCGYDLTDAATSTIYQFGLYVGTVPGSSYTNTQYLTPSMISNSGTLLALENVTPIYRNSSSREIHELVASF